MFSSPDYFMGSKMRYKIAAKTLAEKKSSPSPLSEQRKERVFGLKFSLFSARNFKGKLSCSFTVAQQSGTEEGH